MTILDSGQIDLTNGLEEPLNTINKSTMNEIDAEMTPKSNN